MSATMMRSAWLRARLDPAADDGYTLSEMLVVLVILGVVLAALAGVFVSATKAEVDQNRRFQAQQEARLALDRIRREGHFANAVSVKNASGTAIAHPSWGAQVTLTWGATQVTWCTRVVTASPPRYALWRDPGAACTGTGTKVADHLIEANAFLPPPTAATPRRATLGVRYHVDVDPENAFRVYRLVDDIVLRNTARS